MALLPLSPLRFPGDVPVWDGAAGGPAVAPQGSFFSAAGNEEEEELSLRSRLLFCVHRRALPVPCSCLVL